MSEPWTVERLKALKFRVTLFADGANGMAMQARQCVEEPRLGAVWIRKDRSNRGQQHILVDGLPVKDLEEAAAKLNAPPEQEVIEPDATLAAIKRIIG